MNHEELEYIQGLEKRLAELEAKQNKQYSSEHYTHQLYLMNCKINEIESQVCGAKKGRIENCEESIGTMTEMYSQVNKKVDKLELRMGRIEHFIESEFADFTKQPDGTVTSEQERCKHGICVPDCFECYDDAGYPKSKPSGEKKWKPKDKEDVWSVDLFNYKIYSWVYDEILCEGDSGNNWFKTATEAENFLSKIKEIRNEY